MINDFPDSVFESIFRIFADDTRVTKVIKDEEDIEKLKNIISRVYMWQEEENNFCLVQKHRENREKLP